MCREGTFQTLKEYLPKVTLGIRLLCSTRITCKCSCQLWCIAAYMGRGCWSYSGHRSEGQYPRGVGIIEYVPILAWHHAGWNDFEICWKSLIALCSISQCLLQKASRLQQRLFLLWNQLEMMSLWPFLGEVNLTATSLKVSGHSCCDAKNAQGSMNEGLSTGDFLVIKRIGRKTCMQCAPFTRGTSIKISCVLNLQPLVCTSSKWMSQFQG